MSNFPTPYSNSYSSGSSYSAGIWQGSNAVFPSMPGGSLPGDRVPMVNATSGSTPSGPASKKPSFKLRKSILPKQPLTILHELCEKGKPSFDFYDVPYEERERRAWQMDCSLDDVGCFECRCTIQGMEFIGEGETKQAAKDNVTEIAIQGMISAKCELNENEGGIGTNEDNCPWPQIASLALYKLYNDWQTQGFQLPKELTNINVIGGGGGDVGYAASEGRLGGAPLTDKDKPPLQLLNELASKTKVTLVYDLVSEVGAPNDKVFSYVVKIGEKKYSGQAKNKKAAKQAAAAVALADKDSWYSPPVNHPPPPGDGEESEDQEMGEFVPPKKMKPLMGSEKMKLFFGNDDNDGPPGASQPKIVFKEPQDKGLQPGSYPKK